MGVPSARATSSRQYPGLPTWYEVRVSEPGWLGRRGGVDLMVAMNPQTWDKDVAELEPGGYLFYDSTKPLPKAKFRDDIHVIGMPLMEICNAAYSDPRQRQLFKNIIYVGALATLLDTTSPRWKGSSPSSTRAREAARAQHQGAAHGTRSCDRAPAAIGLQVRASDRVGNRIFLEGNSARGARLRLRGATVAAWYPITPSSSLAEAFAKHCRKYRTDPIAARRATRSFKPRTSSPPSDGDGAAGTARARSPAPRARHLAHGRIHRLAYFAEIPAVIFDVQRAGPSTGMPTRTQQSDVLACAYASHGDTKHVLLFPQDPKEGFEMAAQSFDLADRLQTPVFVLYDLDIGMNERLCEPLAWDDTRRYDRGKVLSYQDLEAGKRFGRYLDLDGDGITYRTYPGTNPKRGSFSPVEPRATATRATPRKAAPTWTTCSAC